MMQQPEQTRRVLVLDRDEARRASTCSLLENAGFPTIAADTVRSLEIYLDDGCPTVLLCDVSLPRSWRSVMDEHAHLRSVVEERCAIVLYGDRPANEFSELEWACRATAHIPYHPDGKFLLSLLRRLLPEPTVPDSRPTRAPSRPDGMLPDTRRKLLLIDDSEMTLELMQSRLARTGFEVRIALALGEVRSIVANWAPNIIVADVRRPDIPGDQLCARLKASVGGSRVLVLLCSSLPDRDLAELAHAARADGYVSKSHGMERFVEQLEAVTLRLAASIPRSHRLPEVP